MHLSESYNVLPVSYAKLSFYELRQCIMGNKREEFKKHETNHILGHIEIYFWFHLVHYDKIYK